MNHRRLTTLALTLLFASCAKPDPTGVDVDGDGIADGQPCASTPTFSEDVSSCQPADDDYQPRVNGSADDTWPACISDDNTYHRINPTISTIARVEAFEQIADKLWRNNRVPSAQDFVDARVIYAQSEGLDSRVQRREDVHYPPPEGGARCSEPGVPEANPDRCVGPITLLPILNDAFVRGAELDRPLVQAARIEAALLWFLYVSVLSEVTSCTDRPQDCDSAWAYYTGGTPRESPIGLARYVQALGPETHQRIYDAVLGVRCWRNLDNETGVASNLALRDQVRAQLDRGLLRGMALIARTRADQLGCATGQFRSAQQELLNVLLPLLDRATRERDPAAADQLASSATSLPHPEATAQVQSTLDTVYACP